MTTIAGGLPRASATADDSDLSEDRHRYSGRGDGVFLLEKGRLDALKDLLSGTRRAAHLRDASRSRPGSASRRDLGDHTDDDARRVTSLILPFRGAFCVESGGGYRVFDPASMTLVRIFDPGLDDLEVERRLESAKRAAALPFAPELHEWSFRDRWYREDLISGRKAGNFSPRLRLRFYTQSEPEILECLSQTITSAALESRPLQEVVRDVTAYVRDGSLADTALKTMQRNIVTRFVCELTKSLDEHRNLAVEFAVSHGDFCARNLIRVREGLHVVDWELAEPRSLLHDLHNLYLTDPATQSPSWCLSGKLESATDLLAESLSESRPEAAAEVRRHPRIYRHLYYLERIRLLFGRGVSNGSLSTVVRTINRFRRYEISAG